MRRLGLFALLFTSQSLVWAQAQNEVVLGVFRQSNAQNFVTGEQTRISPGFGLGVKTQSYDYAGFVIKLGLMYEQREARDVFSGVEHSFKMKHLDLLTHISYQVTDFLSVFAGPQFTVLLSSECKTSVGSCLINSGAHKYFVPMTAGLDFTFMTSYGAEIYHEWISQESWERTLEKTRTYGLNLKYKF